VREIESGVSGLTLVKEIHPGSVSVAEYRLISIANSQFRELDGAVCENFRSYGRRVSRARY
jgi:hypothetical protein